MKDLNNLENLMKWFVKTLNGRAMIVVNILLKDNTILHFMFELFHNFMCAYNILWPTSQPPPPNSSHIPLTLFPSQCYVLCFKTHWVYLGLLHGHGCVTISWSVYNLSWNTPLGKTNFHSTSSHQLPMNLQQAVGLHKSFPFPCFNFG